MEDLKKDILADGKIDAGEVETIKQRIYADGVIDKEEADFLFELNDAVSGAENDPGWSALFVEALTDFVLKDEKTPGVLDEDEATYLIDKIGADGQVDDTELALLVNITAKAVSCCESFQNYVTESLKNAILEDGVIDENEVEMIKTVIYGTGGAGGSDVDRSEADFLFELNDATSGKENHPSWQKIFVEAICKHLLEDEESPGEVDDDEAEWLKAKIEGDGQFDENEKALISALKGKVTSVPQALADLIKAAS